ATGRRERRGPGGRQDAGLGDGPAGGHAQVAGAERHRAALDDGPTAGDGDVTAEGAADHGEGAARQGDVVGARVGQRHSAREGVAGVVEGDVVGAGREGGGTADGDVDCAVVGGVLGDVACGGDAQVAGAGHAHAAQVEGAGGDEGGVVGAGRGQRDLAGE